MLINYSCCIGLWLVGRCGFFPYFRVEAAVWGRTGCSTRRRQYAYAEGICRVRNHNLSYQWLLYNNSFDKNNYNVCVLFLFWRYYNANRLCARINELMARGNNSSFAWTSYRIIIIQTQHNIRFIAWRIATEWNPLQAIIFVTEYSSRFSIYFLLISVSVHCTYDTSLG